MNRRFGIILGVILVCLSIFWMIQLGSNGHVSKEGSEPASQWQIERDETYSDEFNALLDKCEKGNGDACDEAIDTFYNFDDMAHVVYISDHRCNKGDSRQCSYVGYIYLHAIKGMTYDSSKAHSYLTRGCEGGDKRGCDLLKEYRDVNGILAHDRSTRAEQLKIECEQGNRESCVNVAEMLHRGTGVKIDLDSALKYYQKGCDTPEVNTDPRCENPYMIMESMEQTQ